MPDARLCLAEQMFLAILSNYLQDFIREKIIRIEAL